MDAAACRQGQSPQLLKASDIFRFPDTERSAWNDRHGSPSSVPLSLVFVFRASTKPSRATRLYAPGRPASGTANAKTLIFEGFGTASSSNIHGIFAIPATNAISRTSCGNGLRVPPGCHAMDHASAPPHWPSTSKTGG